MYIGKHKSVHRNTSYMSWKFSDSGIYFNTKFEMIHVVSSKMVKNMLLRSSLQMYIRIPVNVCPPVPSHFPTRQPFSRQFLDRSEEFPLTFEDSSVTLLIWFSPIFMIEKLGKLEYLSYVKLVSCGLIICTLWSKLYSHWHTCPHTGEIHDCYENG